VNRAPSADGVACELASAEDWDEDDWDEDDWDEDDDGPTVLMGCLQRGGWTSENGIAGKLRY
jgi:hypothetical protein